MRAARIASRTTPTLPWPLMMRVISLVMAFQLFLLPQLANTQYSITVVEERSSQPPPIMEEEVAKHIVSFRHHTPSEVPERNLVAQFHQYEEMMLDHPLREVPHQPPRS